MDLGKACLDSRPRRCRRSRNLRSRLSGDHRGPFRRHGFRRHPFRCFGHAPPDAAGHRFEGRLGYKARARRPRRNRIHCSVSADCACRGQAGNFEAEHHGRAVRLGPAWSALRPPRPCSRTRLPSLSPPHAPLASVHHWRVQAR